jgi:hypothetical protein
MSNIFSTLLAASSALAFAGPATAIEALDGCWKMVEIRIERRSGKVESPRSDCIRAYLGATLVTSCRGGREIDAYILSDATVATYTFAQVARHAKDAGPSMKRGPARAAAFRVTGSTLHMVLGKSPSASADPVVRADQRLTRILPKECSALEPYLPGGHRWTQHGP